MTNKELLIDFIEYAKSRHILPVLHSNIEPLVEDYKKKIATLEKLIHENEPIADIAGKEGYTKADMEQAFLSGQDYLAKCRDSDPNYPPVGFESFIELHNNLK